MSQTQLLESNSIQQAQEDETLSSLRRAITRSKGFTLLPSICNEPIRREKLTVRLGDSLPNKIIEIHLTGECNDVLAEVINNIDPSANNPVVVYGLESGIGFSEYFHERIASLNQRREEWRDRVPRAVVLWLPEYLLTLLAKGAPDFMDWRSGTYLFPTTSDFERIISSTTEAEYLWGTSRLTNEERLERIRQLKELISEYSKPEHSDEQALFYWYLELTDHLKFKGKLNESLDILNNKLLPQVSSIQDNRLASVLLKIARIYFITGKLEEAQHKFNQTLKIFEELDARRSYAVTLGDIAHIHTSKGEVEQALALHQQVRKIYEELGDRRSCAITLGDIARILKNTGEVEQALALHQKEQKVFEELGDQRSYAVTLGDIARILSSKGEMEQALSLHYQARKIYEELGDPDGIANNSWDVAQIELKKGDIQSGFEHLRKSYEIIFQFGRLDGISIVGMVLGKLYCAKGQRHEGLRILHQSLVGFKKLGWTKQIHKTQELIHQFENQPDPQQTTTDGA